MKYLKFCVICSPSNGKKKKVYRTHPYYYRLKETIESRNDRFSNFCRILRSTKTSYTSLDCDGIVDCSNLGSENSIFEFHSNKTLCNINALFTHHFYLKQSMTQITFQGVFRSPFRLRLMPGNAWWKLFRWRRAWEIWSFAGDLLSPTLFVRGCGCL